MSRFFEKPAPSAPYLSALALVLAVLGEEAAEEVSAAARHVDQRTLLPQAETRRHRQNQGDSLDQQGPFPQVAPDDEAAEDCLDLQQEMMSFISHIRYAGLLETCVSCQCCAHLWDS